MSTTGLEYGSVLNAHGIGYSGHVPLHLLSSFAPFHPSCVAVVTHSMKMSGISRWSVSLRVVGAASAECRVIIDK